MRARKIEMKTEMMTQAFDFKRWDFSKDYRPPDVKLAL